MKLWLLAKGRAAGCHSHAHILPSQEGGEAHGQDRWPEHTASQSTSQFLGCLATGMRAGRLWALGSGGQACKGSTGKREEARHQGIGLSG